MKRLARSVLVVTSGCFFAGIAYAGMPAPPSVSLSELAGLRADTISFFLLVYLLASMVVWKLWNFLRKDFPKLPLLSLKKALGLVLLWGLAFHLVLVMIAGTRELMTPEAWERAGAIYKLAPNSYEQLMNARRYKLDRLRVALWKYTEAHRGAFPANEAPESIADDLWTTPDGKLKYVYVPPVSVSAQARPLAYEPETYGHERFVLLTNGTITVLPVSAIERMLMPSPS